MRFPPHLTAILLVLVVVCASCAPPGDHVTRIDGSRISYAEIDGQVRGIMEAARVPGMQIAVIENGETVYSKAYGVVSNNSKERVGENTVFGAMSFSKTLFAYLVLQLADEGVIDLDTPIVTYLKNPLPEYDFYADLAGEEKRYEMLTPRMVLSHTTGFPNWRWFTPEEKLGFLFEPGDRFSYSGEGFALLQLAAEEATGQGLEALATARIFEPLGLKRTSFSWQPEFEDDYAHDHDDYSNDIGRNKDEEPGAAGSAQTTASDYAVFLAAVMEGRGLSDAMHRELLTPQVTIEHVRMFGPLASEALPPDTEPRTHWNLGWGHVETEHGPAIFHTGRDSGSANYHVAFPDRGLAVILLGNSGRLENAAPALTELLIGDRYSPWGFLGYEPYTSTRHRFVDIVTSEGLEAGLEYYRSADDTGVGLWFPDEVAFMDQAGRDLYGLDCLDEAAELYRHTLDENPDWAEGYVRLAQSHVARDDYQTAHRVFEEGMEHVGLDSAQRDELEWRLAWVAAVVEPRDVADTVLREYEGTYGPRRVELHDGVLFYSREGASTAAPRPLYALSDDTFVLKDVDFFKVKFARGAAGTVDRIVGLYLNGEQDESLRVSN
ncbi:MAG: serine hydrolase domain-containing protein [Acidobacteriota bacterium]|nr:serine hydrolase domain-containing protein [Acidobacteriota bacterium]